MILWIVTMITIVSLVVAVGMSPVQNKSKEMISVINMCSITFQIGFGTICGLIAGFNLNNK